MTRMSMKLLACAGIGMISLAAAGMAFAAPADQAQASGQSTPGNWSWEIKDGKRVPKPSSRIVNQDGSWKETTKQGNCVTVKERTAGGEYKETRTCQ